MLNFYACSLHTADIVIDVVVSGAASYWLLAVSAEIFAAIERLVGHSANVTSALQCRQLACTRWHAVSSLVTSWRVSSCLYAARYLPPLHAKMFLNRGDGLVKSLLTAIF
jgi:hypothetical protein